MYTSARARHVGAFAWAAAGLAACAGQPPLTSDDLAEGREQGVVHVQINAPKALGASDFSYDITGNDVPHVVGLMVGVPNSEKVTAIVSLPVGTGYTLNIESSLANGSVPCATSVNFDIKAQQTTALDVRLQCEDGTEIGVADAGRSTGKPTDAGAPDAQVDSGSKLDSGRAVFDAGRPNAVVKPQPDVSVPAPQVSVSDAGPPDAGPPDAGQQMLFESCEVCSERACSAPLGVQRNADCYQTTGKVAEGLAKGESRATVCKALMDCAHRTGCGSPNYEACYCGAQLINICQSEGPLGLCRREYEAAAETTDPTLLLQGVTSPGVLGIASRILQCEAANCSETCFAKKN